MIKIRLMRIGGRQRPFYRVVAVDERAKRTGGYIELLGTYNPLTEPKDIKLKQGRIDWWLKQGAQPSDGFLRIIGKAPQRPPRKPKKSKQGTVDSGQEKSQVKEEAAEQSIPEKATSDTSEVKQTATEHTSDVGAEEQKDEGSA